MIEVAMQTLDRYQVRSQRTLTRVLEAAEEMFVRDGFESAQMDDIAARAERSKRTIYLHFKSKEDLFLALIEHRIKKYVDRYNDRIRQCATRQKRLIAFREYYEDLVRDRAYHVLTLEFKLFALRHPEWKERYQKAFAAQKRSNGDTDLEEMHGALSREQQSDLLPSVFALGPIANSVVLESYFEPSVFSDKALRKLLGRIFNALIVVV